MRIAVPHQCRSFAMGLIILAVGACAHAQVLNPNLKASEAKLGVTHGQLTILNVADLSREPAERKGSMLVLVNSTLFPDLKTSIAIYTADLARQGYQTKVKLITRNYPPTLDPFFSSFRDLKWVIREWWTALTTEVYADELSIFDWMGNSGVVLVGQFPIPIVHGRIGHWEDAEKGTSGCYEGCYVSDLYLTDLNGNWDTNVDQVGIPLYSTVDTTPAPDSECAAGDQDDAKWLAPSSEKLGYAGARPEIFLGRIDPARLCGGSRATEVQLLKEYFARNHEYRLGKWAGSTSIPLIGNVVKWPRLAWYDDDWVDYGAKVAHAMNKAWPGAITANPAASPGEFTTAYVSDTSLTTKADYMSRLQNTQWLWVDMLAHSSPWVHEIHVGEQHQNLWDNDVATAGFKSLFYWLQGCDTSDIRQNSNLGTTYLFRNQALAVIGNTSVGPVDNGQFYTALGWGYTVGQAFMVNEQMHGSAGWQPNLAGPKSLDPKRYYPWLLLGDPALPTVPPDAPQWNLLLNQSAALRASVIASLLGGQSQSAYMSRLSSSVRRAALATPDRATVARDLKPGMAYLEVQRGRAVIDPQWKTWVRPGVTLDLKPNLKVFQPLRAPQVQPRQRP